ncbi:hypothetical protein BH11BAC1_BH11BAC1_06560 [soil metagenome]
MATDSQIGKLKITEQDWIFAERDVLYKDENKFPFNKKTYSSI